MDDPARVVSGSIRWRLAGWMSGAIIGVTLLAGAISFSTAFDEAHELQDELLQQIAGLAARQAPSAPEVKTDDEEVDEESELLIERLPEPSPDATPRLLTPALPDGLHTLTSEGERFRVYVRTLGAGRRVAVAQPTELRDQIALDGALRTVLPLLVLLPILLGIIVLLVSRMLLPVRRLAAALDARGEDDLQTLPATDIPQEIRPFVLAINRLLARLGLAMEAQRRFIADAAHELRTPMTALSLQAERLQATDLPDGTRERLTTLKQGIARTQQLLNQLLGLAHAQNVRPDAGAPRKVGLRAVCHRVLADLLPVAEAKAIDVGLVGERDAELTASGEALYTLIRNLVDNAIRYTPTGGRVDIAIEPATTHVNLTVTDTGPGIPPGERERVFDPFYRIVGNAETGSGLGLAIVRTLAQRLGARVDLDYADSQTRRGLRVTVRLPLPSANGRERR